jgi:hypothetical protein
MAKSKRAEKERLKKERVSKLGKELLDKEMKSKDIQQRIATATSGGYDGDKFYGPSKWITSMPKKELASRIIEGKNRKMSGGNAAERMKADKKTMGYNVTPKTGLRGVVADQKIFYKNLSPLQKEDRYEKLYGRGKGSANSENKRRANERYQIKNDFSLKNKWEDESYGANKKKKKK